MIDRYPGSKFTEAFPGEMFISPPSRCGSNISVSNDHPDYKVSTQKLTLNFDMKGYKLSLDGHKLPCQIDEGF